MNNITEGHFTLSDEQRRFKELLAECPRLVGYWDFGDRSCDVERLRKDLSVLSSGEAIMAKFYLAVWSGQDDLGFDLIDAVKSLDPEHLDVIVRWLAHPEFP